MNARPADKLAIAVAQLNSTVGDIAGNAEKVRRARMTAAAQGADLVVFPELFIAGYPPEDLVLKPAFQAVCRAAVEALARETASGGPALLVGTPWLDGGKLYNAVALLDGGAIAALRFKVDLPNYGVFDEKRVFAPGPMPGPVNFRGVRLGLPICEDIWGEEIVECLAETGAERLALLAPEGRRAAQHRGGARYRAGIADNLRQSGGRPGRTGVRRRVVRAACRLFAGVPARGISGSRGHHSLGSAGRHLALRKWTEGRAGRSRARRLRGLRAGLARLRQQEWISRRGARPVRRHRFRIMRGDGGRRPRRRPRSLHHAALQIHRAGIARRCRGLRQGAGRALSDVAN